METGLYTRDQVPRHQYDKLEELNVSKLCVIEESPAHFQHALLEPITDTDEKILGRATHIAVFEPDLFNSRTAKWEGGRRYGKDWDAFKAENRGRELLTESMHEKALAIGQAVRRDEHAAKFLKDGRSELTLIWTHVFEALTEAMPGYEIRSKGRIDFDRKESIVDLKTTGSAKPSRFERTAADFHYHAKAAWYADGYFRITGERKPFDIIAVETKPPYVVQVYNVEDEELELGRKKYREWLDRYAFCKATNKWIAYSDGPVRLTLPKWLMPYDEENDPTGLGLVIGG